MEDINPRKYRSIFVLLLMGVMILWPALSLLGVIPSIPSLYEKRNLAPMPGLPEKAEDFTQWPRRFEHFLEENLGNRGALVFANNWVRYHVFGTSPTSSVLVGRQGWLFHNVSADIRDYQGELDRKPYQIRRLRITLEERRDWLAERGIDYAVVVAPTKQTIYPEYMPEGLRRGENSLLRRELLAREIAGSADPVMFIDTTPGLKKAKHKFGDSLFYKHDSHWTYLGAWLAYRDVVRQLPNWFAETDTLDFIDIPVDRESNLAQLMGLHGFETTLRPTPLGGFRTLGLQPDTKELQRISKKGVVDVYEQKTSGKGILYFIGDSFAGWDIQYFSEHFRRTVLTNTWGAQWPRLEQFPVTAIGEEKPDLVIQQLVENRLDIGHARSLLTDPRGVLHPQSVRTARLRRLFNASDKTAAIIPVEHKEVGNVLSFSLPAEKWRAYIVRLQLRVSTDGSITAPSPYSEQRQWDDLCTRGAEMNTARFKPGMKELFLCVVRPQDGSNVQLVLDRAVNLQGIERLTVRHHPDI